MAEKQKETNQQASATSVASFLYGVIVFAGAGFIVKLAWNLGIASLFPGNMPTINYGQAIAWLIMLYIAARVISAGYMAEVERTISNLTDHLKRFVDLAQDLIDVANSRNVSNDLDDSDLN